MYKKVLKAVFVTAIAFIAGAEMLSSYKMMNLSEIALANVEALASSRQIDMRRGYKLVQKSPGCSVCEWTGVSNDYCNVHEQEPNCYGGKE